MGISKLFIIGDSISMQYGPYLKQALHGKMDVSRKGDLSGEGDLDPNGRDSNVVVAYLNQLIEQRFKTDLLLINSGLHDIKKLTPKGNNQVEPDSYRANLEHITTLFPNIAHRMIWVSSTPVDDALHNSRNPEFQRYNADVVRYNQIAQAVMLPAAIPIIDLYRFTVQLEDRSSLFEDHVHFTEAIRMLHGDFIAGSIRLLCEEWGWSCNS